MNKRQFLAAVEERLKGLPSEDIARALDYFGEMIDDLIEDGLSEEEAVAAMGPAQEASERIMMDMPLKKVVRARTKPQRALKAWEIALLALGSPLWASLLLTALALVLTAYILLWTIVAALYSVVLAVLTCALAGAAAGAVYIFSANVPGGIMLLGCSLICAGLTILMLLGCNRIAAAMAGLSRTTGRRIKSLFVRRGDR